MNKSLHRIFRLTYGGEQWLMRRFTISGLVVLLCIPVAAVAGLDTNSTLAYQIFTFLLALLGIAFVTSLSFRDRFTVTRILPRFGTVGVPLTYRVVVHNQTRKLQTNLKLLEDLVDPRPSFAEFRATPEPDEAQRHPIDQKIGYYRWLWLLQCHQRAIAKPKDLPPLLPNSKTEVGVELIPTHRGLVQFLGVSLARPDPLGLCMALNPLKLPQSLLILPKLYPLPPVRLPGLRRYQSGGISLASSVGDSEEFMALRDYRPGDPLRKIHWRSWAKTGKPIVREEQNEFFVRHALILDTFQETAYSETLEAAISVAASFACEVQTQESLLDLMFVGTEAYCFTSGRGIGHTDGMLEILASVIACQDKPFDSLFPSVLNRVTLLSGCICILLKWDEARKNFVSHLQAMQIPMLVLVIVKDSVEANTIRADSGTLDPTQFHVLTVDNLAEELMQL